MQKHWFKSKKYGWGFVPISWQGWLMIIVLILLTLLSTFLTGINQEVPSLKQSLAFLFDLLLIISIFSLIAFKKCKDKPRWRWGK